MKIDPFTFQLEEPGDDAEIETLHSNVFGPGRFARAAYRLREGVRHEPDLSFVSHAGQELVASVRLTRIAIGGHSYDWRCCAAGSRPSSMSSAR